MAGKRKSSLAVPIEHHKHRDHRRNIPTEELRDFVREDDRRPVPVNYPRDPSLDPQLVWKGKDEQDATPLEVPAVPVYIQEKIHPQAIVEDFRRTADKNPDNNQQQVGGLFADFNGLPEEFDKRVDFYHHEGHWSNRMILGDSLLVLTSLAEKEGLKGKVQAVYIDPPYGIRFGSNWQVSTRRRDVKDGKVEDATRQPEQVKAFRDTWKLGIHSYLAYLRDRLTLTRELLTESGSIFVQIGDENVHLVRCLLDEVFGSEQFKGFITFRVKSPLNVSGLGRLSDYILWYAKNAEHVKYRQLFVPKLPDEQAEFNLVELATGERMTVAEATKRHGALAPDSRRFTAQNLASSGYTQSCTFTFKHDGRSFPPPGGKSWKTTKDGMAKLAVANRLHPLDRSLRFAYFADDFPVQEISNLWTDTFAESDKAYVVQTSTKVVERCLLMTTDPGDLVLDPTCGSGTTAYVAEQWGRRWITTDTSRVALALARTRLMTARFPFYLLADSSEGVKKEAELTGKVPPPYKTENDTRKGFVYQRVPHVTLKSIANNPDIKEGMSRTEIDRAILRHAETETLYDKPYLDMSRLRVTGPFTVESLSPHRTISVEDKRQAAEKPSSEGFAIKMLAGGSFSNTILDYLRKSPIQTGKKEERLKLESVEVFAGQWINGEGRYAEADGTEKRVAICIGPEYGTVGPELVKEAAKEAVKGVGFDVLLVCGFAFDPHVTEEAKRYGKLKVLPVRMNPDLSMGDELLKKTGAGNLFMVFGEPDLSVDETNDGKLVVTIRGVDVYDPTTGDVRSNTTDDIACWFLDTDYDGESFFVRHAYFTGADEPYEKLKRALRAEIDEAAWSALYSTKSRPFENPSRGKIAVKVINHYGDEVLKVYEISGEAQSGR
jgi:adenine-specific DNA-methyltransferase